jgi:hypothetical protein
MDAPRLKFSEPLQETVRYVRVTLFEQFHWNKWLLWGVLAFLGANLAAGGGIGFPGFPGESSSGDSGPAWTLPDIQAWIDQNLDLVLFLLIAGLVAFLLVSVLIMAWLYIACRGRFMFVECLMENKTALAESWQNNGREAMSLFWWFNVYYSVVFLFLLLALAGGFFIFYQDGQWRALADVWPRLAALGAVALLGILAMAVVAVYLEDFVVPLMWVRRIGVMEAWRVFRGHFRAQPGAFLLYLPIRLGLSLGASTALFLGTCLTCCLAALPVIGQALLLPLYVGMRMYPVLVLAQVEPALRPRLDAAPRTAAPAAGPAPPDDSAPTAPGPETDPETA